MSIEVVIGELRAHANALDGISASGCEAVQAGAYVTTQGEAFGLLCSFVGAHLLPVQQLGISSASAATGMVSGLAGTVRAVATTLETTDDLVGTTFDFLKGE